MTASDGVIAAYVWDYGGGMEFMRRFWDAAVAEDPAAAVEDGCVFRQRRAYPVYDEGYSAQVLTSRKYLALFRNLQTAGRNGMHRYNNQDHSMLTGLLAARNVLGDQHDLWEVNIERSYQEEQQLPRQQAV